jgi:anti-sigma regulatory factor (Ser/Thr protein kinase)
MSAPPAPAAGRAAARPCVAPLPARSPGPADAPARDYRDSPGSHASADLRAEPAAARRARRLTRDTLARWHLHHLADDAEAIASELIANALNVATTPRGTLPAIILAIHRRPDELRISVWDNGPGHPRPAEPAPDDETGRGLAIIDHLTGRNWGWWPTPISAGKVVWAALAAASAPDDGPQDSPC